MTPEQEKDLLHRFKIVESKLSPENLCSDGLASRSEVQRRLKALNKKKKELIRLFGREPSFREIWGL